MRLRVVFIAFFSIAIAETSAAKDARIGSANLTLPPPDGFCELTEKEPSDRHVIEVSKAGTSNEVLSISADCSQLQSFRAGKRKLLDDLANYQTTAGARDSDVSVGERSKRVSATCADLRTQGEKYNSSQSADFNARMQAVTKNLKMNESRFFGVLTEDSDACYFAMVQKIQTEFGTEKTVATVAATTVLGGKDIFYYVVFPYEKTDDVTAALARHRRNVEALLAANKN